MRASSLLTLLGFALLLPWVLGLTRSSLSQTVVHHPIGVACSTCHVAGADTHAENAHILVAAQEALCGRCHADAVRVSHPSGFRPNRALPASYPVDWKGDLTCSTCHEVHGDTPGMLRGSKRGRPLCQSCHDKAFFDGMRDQGISLVQSGHLNLNMRQIMQELDAFSINCMGCHGQYGDDNAVTIDTRRIITHTSTSLNHPIGRSYDNARRFGGYRPQAMLSKKILLPNGRLSCVSCHEGYSKEHGRLVVSQPGTSLCLQCHDL